MTGPIQVPNTGGWYNWVWLDVSGIVLTPGQAVIRVAMDTESGGGQVGVFDSMSFTLDAPAVSLQILGDPATRGNPTPYGYGGHGLVAGTAINESVASPAAGAAGTHYICTG